MLLISLKKPEPVVMGSLTLFLGFENVYLSNSNSESFKFRGINVGEVLISQLNAKAAYSP